jgi:hypothetical protein
MREPSYGGNCLHVCLSVTLLILDLQDVAAEVSARLLQIH